MNVVKDCTFLYVEDDPLSREALKVVFTRVMGVDRLHVFENSVDFLTRVRALPRKPDLFLLDIHMRPLSGFEMLDLLRSDPVYFDARVIALTASVMNEEVAMLRQSGFNGAIAKPIMVTTFPGLIERIMRGEEVWHITEGC